MKVFFVTFGCKVNASEDESLASELALRGIEAVKDATDADIAVLNTCAVTEVAAKKCAAYITKLRKNYPSIKIIATGCFASDSYANLQKYGADTVVPNVSKDSLIDIIMKNANTAEHRPPSTTKRMKHTRAFYKIQDGCDSFCTYCIIPTLRGAPKSLPLGEAVDGFKKLLAEGYKEIVLVGIHIGLYGKGEGYSLTSLLCELIEIEGDFRIRLSSVEVNEITDELIALIAESNGKICPHLHIPLQSGSAHILERMGRRYVPSDYIKVIAKARMAIKNLIVGSDIIVGFPSETDAHFLETVKTLETAGTEFYHVFPYSDRRGTKASAMGGKLSEQEKATRADKLRIIGERSAQSALKISVGKIFTVLTERGNKGHTENYIPVILKDTQHAPNKFIKIRITEVKEGKACGEDI